MHCGVLELRSPEVTNSSCSVLATSHWNQETFKIRFIKICKLRHRICNFSTTTQWLWLFCFLTGDFFFFVILFTEISSSLIWIFSVWQQQKYPDQNSALKFYPKKHQNQQKNSAKIRGEREAKKTWSSLLKNKYFPLSNSNYVSKIKIKALKVLLLHVGHVLLQHFLWYWQQMLCPTPKAALIILNSYFPPKSRLEMKYFNYTLLI